MLEKTKAIVLSSKNIGEHDRLLTLLTQKFGVITAFANSSRRMKSPLCTSSGQFTYGDFLLFKSRDKYTVSSAEIERMFYGLREDIEKLALANYLCALINQLSGCSLNSKKMLRLLANTLHLLEHGAKPLGLLKPSFELRALSYAGFMPNLIACNFCGEFQSDLMLFSAIDSTLCCDACYEVHRNRNFTPINPGVLLAMRHIIYSDFEKMFSFSMSNDGFEKLQRISESYAISRLEYLSKALKFYHNITKPSAFNLQEEDDDKSKIH